ncbi:hypothetical protein LCGC14_0560320 [marine sediment metagenome]|uniref:Uncharacterized protein n=1 Tax=marine sediment metagenome TaxID=412755 RepID=A0A0F9RSE6_9ZZZZ
MSWKIKTYWNCCSYIKYSKGKPECYHPDNKGLTCNEENCPIKV